MRFSPPPHRLDVLAEREVQNVGALDPVTTTMLATGFVAAAVIGVLLLSGIDTSSRPESRAWRDGR